MRWKMNSEYFINFRSDVMSIEIDENDSSTF